MEVTKTMGEFMELRSSFDSIGKIPGVGLAIFTARNVKKISAELDTIVEAFKKLPEYIAQQKLVEEKRAAVESSIGKMKFKDDEEKAKYINDEIIKRIMNTPENDAFLAKDKEVRESSITIDLLTIRELDLPSMITAQQMYPILELITQ